MRGYERAWSGMWENSHREEKKFSTDWPIYSARPKKKLRAVKEEKNYYPMKYLNCHMGSKSKVHLT